MPKKTHGLGRGLDSLFQTNEEWGVIIQDIPLGELDPNPDQARKTFEEEGIGSLADSIRVQGIIQPLLVQPTGGGRYQIVAGERRFRAARQAGLDKVPCIVRDMNVLQQMEISLIENLQREDLNPMEKAQGLKALMEQGYTQEKLGERLGMSREAIANMLRLFDLPEPVCQLIREGKLTGGHGKALAGLRDEKKQIALARRAVEEKLTVRQMEQIIAALKAKQNGGKRGTSPLSPELNELQDKLRLKTGLKSRLLGDENQGRIVLQYSTRDELERLNELLDALQEP